MNDEAIRQHKKMAMDGLGSVESPFKNGQDHGAPSRGELGDRKRGSSGGVLHTAGRMKAQGASDHGDY